MWAYLGVWIKSCDFLKLTHSFSPEIISLRRLWLRPRVSSFIRGRTSMKLHGYVLDLLYHILSNFNPFGYIVLEIARHAMYCIPRKFLCVCYSSLCDFHHARTFSRSDDWFEPCIMIWIELINNDRWKFNRF